MYRITTGLLLIVFGSLGRYLLQDVPNIETITVVSLLAGSLLGGRWTLIVGLSTVAITDILIGNTAILLYTWSAWAAMGVFGWLLRHRSKKPLRHALELTGMGFLANIAFFLWTNLGVWHIGGLYDHTLSGLLASYAAGLPFLKMQMLGTAIIVPTVSVVALLAWNAATQRARTALPSTQTH